MNNEKIIVVVLLGAIAVLGVLTAVRIFRLTLSIRDLGKFLAIVAVLALMRISILLYIQHRVWSHTFSDGVGYLYYVLYPEFPMLLLVPARAYPTYLVVMMVGLIAGSFLWALPLLNFLALKPNAERARVSRFHIVARLD